jgi:hypothetical protein
MRSEGRGDPTALRWVWGLVGAGVAVGGSALIYEALTATGGGSGTAGAGIIMLAMGGGALLVGGGVAAAAARAGRASRPWAKRALPGMIGLVFAICLVDLGAGLLRLARGESWHMLFWSLPEKEILVVLPVAIGCVVSLWALARAADRGPLAHAADRA